jgi:hypothetical protein
LAVKKGIDYELVSETLMLMISKKSLPVINKRIFKGYLIFVYTFFRSDSCSRAAEEMS